MPKVFISYRRNDTLAFTGRLHDKLTDRFGPGQVFMDFDNIPFGADFREHLNVSLEKCDVLLAVIGPNWTGKSADGNKNRISDPTDFVRLELQVALEREIPIIPVLVGNATMPTEKELPTDLEPLLYRQAAPVDMARDFHVHAERVIAGIEHIARPATGQLEDQNSKNNARDLLEFLKSLIRIDEGTTLSTLSAWISLGILTGILSSILFEYSFNSNSNLRNIIRLGPGLLFAGPVLLMGKYGTDIPLMKYRKFDLIVILIGCIAGWWVAYSLGQYLANSDQLFTWGLCGSIGMAFVTVSIFMTWDIQEMKWWYGFGFIILGGLSGSMCVFVGRLNIWPNPETEIWLLDSIINYGLPLFIPWQATVFAGMAGALKIFREQ